MLDTNTVLDHLASSMGQLVLTTDEVRNLAFFLQPELGSEGLGNLVRESRVTLDWVMAQQADGLQMHFEDIADLRVRVIRETWRSWGVLSFAASLIVLAYLRSVEDE